MGDEDFTVDAQSAASRKRITSCKHILHYCDTCYGPMEFHDGCIMMDEPHWYCQTANCGNVITCNEQAEPATRDESHSERTS